MTKPIPEDLQRIVILGNSGSGKTYLARKLTHILQSPIIHLDHLFWETGGYTQKRHIEVVHREIRDLAEGSNWIMEGVFGELAAIALGRATTFIFLNKDWEECESSLIERGPEAHKQHDALQAEESFRDLLAWAKNYTKRENSRSLQGHMKLYENFNGTKFEFHSRAGVDEFLRQLS